MPKSSKAFSIRLPFPAKFRARKNILAVEDADLAGLEIPRSMGVPFGPKWIVTLDVKLITCLCFSVVFYAIAAFLANEWLYLLSAGLVVASTFGFWLPLFIIRCLAVDCSIPASGVAADDANISILLRHAKWLGPLKYLVPLRSMRTRVILARRTTSGFLPHRDLGEQSIILDDIGLQTTMLLSVPQLGRGVYKMSHITICTSYPLGLAWWTRKVLPTQARFGEADTIVIYPRVQSLRGDFLAQLHGMLSQMGVDLSERLALTQSNSVRGLRDYRVGDSLRHVHWRSSARQSKLLVREFDCETLPIFDLYFDLTAPWNSREQFELAACLAHSLIQFGYERDAMPELYLRPSLDSEALEDLMSDLPMAQAPLEMMSEVLARVEPIIANVPQPDVQTHRELLTVTPGPDSTVQLVSVSKNDSGEFVGQRAHGRMIATIHSYSDMEAL